MLSEKIIVAKWNTNLTLVQVFCTESYTWNFNSILLSGIEVCLRLGDNLSGM